MSLASDQTFVSSLYRTLVIDKAQFTLKISDTDSQIEFGSNSYSGTQIPMIVSRSWEFAIDGIKVGSDSYIVPETMTAVIDSASSLIMIPASIYYKVINQLLLQVPHYYLNNWTAVACNEPKLKDLYLHLG